MVINKVCSFCAHLIVPKRTIVTTAIMFVSCYRVRSLQGLKSTCHRQVAATEGGTSQGREKTLGFKCQAPFAAYVV